MKTAKEIYEYRAGSYVLHPVDGICRVMDVYEIDGERLMAIKPPDDPSTIHAWRYGVRSGEIKRASAIDLAKLLDDFEVYLRKSMLDNYHLEENLEIAC